MKATSQPASFFDSLKHGLEEAIEHTQGHVNLRTTVIPDEPPTIDAETIQHLRQRANMSQQTFASLLSVSTKTVQSWEQGTRTPSGTALRLIQIFAEHPKEFCQSVGLPEVALHGVQTRQSKGKRTLIVR